MVYPGGVLCGRALTVIYMPLRKVENDVTNKIGKEDGRIGNQVSWPIDRLVKGDVYVTDVYNREIGGPIIGGNLAKTSLRFLTLIQLRTYPRSYGCS
jgi:4-hydroxy-4-methyl-2-oxoglutarate aldolase